VECRGRAFDASRILLGLAVDATSNPDAHGDRSDPPVELPAEELSDSAAFVRFVGAGSDEGGDGGADTPMSRHRSLVEASRAVDVGVGPRDATSRRCSTSSGSSVCSPPPADDLADVVDPAIGGLLDHDRANHTDLTESLGVSLETRNMAEAARRRPHARPPAGAFEIFSSVK
jgi:hypothetical protein